MIRTFGLSGEWNKKQRILFCDKIKIDVSWAILIIRRRRRWENECNLKTTASAKQVQLKKNYDFDKQKLGWVIGSIRLIFSKMKGFVEKRELNWYSD